MAKKKKSNSTPFLQAALVGVLAYLLLNRQTPYTRETYPAFPQIPPRPVSGPTEAFDTWVQSILNLYGTSKKLWEPGGPFYKLPKDLYDRVPNPAQQQPGIVYV